MRNKKIVLCLLLLMGLLSFGALHSQSANSYFLRFKGVDDLKAYMKWMPGKAPLISAHRGGPMTGFPENAIETFENALTFGPVLIECDVAMCKDGHMVMMHDDTLDRTTTGSGNIADFTLAQLKTLFLKDPSGTITPYRIPTFEEVLQWAVGKAVLTVDSKRNVGFPQIVTQIRRYKAEGHVIIITYHFNQLQEVYRLAPDLMLSASAGSVTGTQTLLSLGIPYANLCAFVGVYEPDPRVYGALHEKHISTILGTMHNLDNKAAVKGCEVYKKLYRDGADILTTDNIRLVSEAIAQMKGETADAPLPTLETGE